MSTDKQPIPEWLKQQAFSRTPEYLKDSERNKGRFVWEQGYAAGAMDFIGGKPSSEQKPVHPVFKGWDSLKLIGRVRERFKELIHKGWDWRSYYNGWLEGRAGMLQEMQKEWDAPSPSPRLDIAAFSKLSAWRAETGFKTYRNVPITYWTTAMMGEGGELCNMIKKMERVAHGGIDGGSSYTAASLNKADLAEEIGGIFIYLNILSGLLDIDMEEAIIETFNSKSMKYGFPQFYPSTPRPACTCEHGPTDDNPTCSYPNCHPEGGGEGTFHCQSEIAGEAECAVQCDHCREYYKPFEAPEAQPMEGNYADYYAVHGTCHLHGPYVGQCLICNTGVATTTDSNIEPIADGKEVPEEMMQWIKSQWEELELPDNHNHPDVFYASAIAMYHKMEREEEAFAQMCRNDFNSYKAIEDEKLRAARNEISTQGEQIAKLQLELKAAQGNLTAMIEEALQKSKQLDDARGYFEKIRQYLPHQISRTNPYK